MANDVFLHDEDGINVIVNDVKDTISLYKENIKALEKLINSMDGSSSWLDDDVKTSYINTAKGYISSYNNFVSGLENYVQCLIKKSENVVEHETNYS